MFSLNKTKFFAVAILLCIFMRKVEGRCILKVSQTEGPLITQKFGSKSIIRPKWSGTSIEINENEQIAAYCGNGFAAFNIRKTYSYNQYNTDSVYSNKSVKKLHFKCTTSKIFVGEEPTNEDIYLYNDPTITCNGPTYSMFESADTLSNCQNSMSYLLGAKTSTPIILAGLCYDLEKLKLNYINYRMQTDLSNSAVMDKVKELYPIGINSKSLLEPLNNVENFFQFLSDTGIKADIAKKSELNYWLSVADYEKSNIVQTESNFKSTAGSFLKMLDIIWWHPLRVGNWKRFVKLLEKQTVHVNYIIYTGTSGTVQIPRQNNCESEVALEIDFADRKIPVPQLIWTYVTSNEDYNLADFVVISYNSPYFDYFAKNSTVICNDMCDNIEWMKPLKDSRYISTLGVLYCCHPEEVAEYLDGFPKSFDDANAIEVTSADP